MHQVQWTHLFVLLAVFYASAADAAVKTKVYANASSCANTFRIATGRVLTPRGLIEDPTVNAIVKKAIAAQMRSLKMDETADNPSLTVRFMGGNSAGLMNDSLTEGDIAMWDIGAPQAIPGKTYKKSTLVLVVVETKSNHTLWAAMCSDKFGDPKRMEERIQKAIAQAFGKFPRTIACR